MSFWNGDAWVPEHQPVIAPRQSRLTDWLATGVLIVVLSLLVFPFSSSRAATRTLTVTPTAAAVGQTVTAMGAGLPSRARVQVIVDESSNGLPSATADRQGKVRVSFVVPNVASGAHQVGLRLVEKGRKATGEVLVVAALTVAVAAAPTPTSAPTIAPAPTPTPPAATQPAGPTATPAPTAPAPTSTPTPTPTAPAPPTPTPAPANTYYVATTGSDTGPGTSSAPWRTIANAVSVAPAGATILVRAGTYAPFAVSRDGLVVAADAGAVPVIGGGATGITITASNTTVRGLRVTGSSNQAVWVDGADGVLLDALTVDRNAGHGIQVIRSRHVSVTNSTISSNGLGGIRELDGTTGGAYIGNVITDNGHDGQPYNGDGILLQGSWALVSGNTILRNGDNDMYEHGIYAATIASGYDIRDNTIRDNAASGIKASGSGQVRNNAISGSVRGVVFADDGASVTVKDNTISASLYAILVTSNCNLDRYSSDYNAFGTKTFGLGGPLTFTDWKTTTGLDGHST